MGSFNLNNPVDFARAVGAPVGGLISALTGIFDTGWDIEESAYGHNGVAVKFHIFKTSADYDAAVDSVQDSGGRRKTIFEFPYTDGQTTDDLGRRGETFNFNILISGPKYKAAMLRLLREFNNPRPGLLQHPVRGALNVVAHEWNITHESSSSNACIIQATFLEHNFDVSFQTTEKKATVKSKLAQAVSYFAKFVAAVNFIDGLTNVPQSLISSITSGINFYNNEYAVTLQRLNKTFNQGSSDDIPGLLPTNSGGGDTFSVVQSPSDPFAGVPVGELETSQFDAFSAQQAIDYVKILRQNLSDLIDDMSNSLGGQGAFEFFDQIQELKQSGVVIQQVLEKGLQTSSASVFKYTVPEDMGIREVAFANGLVPDRSIEIEILNPAIESTNFIAKGTELLVPVA